MPELNMYTVRPNDGGLTRFVTRGIEDILPVPEFESPSRPPTEAEWDDVSDFFQTSEPPLSVEKPPTTDICKTQNTSSLRSPLYIDASNLSPRSHTPVGEMVTPSGPVASFSGFLSNSPASFTLSPTMSHSDSSEVGFRRPTDEVQVPYLPFSTSHSPSTPHSAPILYQTGLIGHCCDCGEAFDPIFTTSTRACTQLSPYPPQLNEEECGSPRFSSSSLPVISTAIASAVDVVQQWIDTRASSAATAANSTLTNQDVFLNSLHETVKLLLVLATNDGRLIERDTTKTIRPSMQIPPSPASPTKPMDALTAALLAPPVCCDSRPFDARFSDCFDPSFGDCTDSPDRCAHLQPGLSASTKESDHIGLNDITHTAQLLASPNVDTMAGATNFPIHRQYPIENPRVKHQSSNASSHSVSSIICQVPMIIQALQRLCTCQGVSLNERVSDLLEKLRHILSALAENTAVNQTMTAVTVSSAPTFASVGTQSDQLASQCDFQTSGELDGGLPPFRRCSTGTSLPSGHSELIDPRLKNTESRMRGSFRASTGTAPSQLFVKQIIKKSNPGKRTSASFPLDHPIQIPQPGDHTSTMETVGFPDSTVSSSLKQVSCDSHISSGGPTRRKQRALSESNNSHHHLFLDPTQQAHSFPLKSDVKKCRKVYGIENRSQWCNQCRWKKACRRFPDVAVKRSINPVTAGCTTTITTSVSSNICSTIASLPSSELNRLSTPSSILELQDRPVPATTSHS